jgi:hypothetical protein
LLLVLTAARAGQQRDPTTGEDDLQRELGPVDPPAPKTMAEKSGR